MSRVSFNSIMSTLVFKSGARFKICILKSVCMDICVFRIRVHYLNICINMGSIPFESIITSKWLKICWPLHFLSTVLSLMCMLFCYEFEPPGHFVSTLLSHYPCCIYSTSYHAILFQPSEESVFFMCTFLIH